MISAVIPAYNEGKNIRNVLSVLVNHPLIAEIIVVSDGSTDDTADRARENGARVIEFLKNEGKGAALMHGVDAASGDVIFFLDADIIGITHEDVSRIIEPVASGSVEMFVAIRGRKILWLNRFLRYFPILGGERVLTRRLWYLVPEMYKHRFQVEIALNFFAKRSERTMGFALFSHIRHVVKEKKYGVPEGFARRIGMIVDILIASASVYILRPHAMLAHRYRKTVSENIGKHR